MNSKKHVDHEHIIYYAFKYALTRHTYAVNEVAEYIIQNWAELSRRNQNMILEDIREHLKDHPNTKKDIDAQAWKRVVYHSQRSEGVMHRR